MEREDLDELHFITPIENVQSIFRRGILSHNLSKCLPHKSVAMANVQDKRAAKVVPGGRPLHDYANLYICARNPMLYKRKDGHSTLCVLRISPDVIDLAGVVISDSNAASDYVRFARAPEGLSIVDRAATFSEWWTDNDPIEKFRKAARKCAEVLVPERVPSQYIIGAIVSGEEGLNAFDLLECGVRADVDGHFFFR